MSIDFHAHILPRADHGSDGLDTSLYQLASAAEVGVSVVVASAHFYPERHSLEEFLTRRAVGISLLERAAERPKQICVRPGAEVAIYPGMEKMEGLEKLCVAGSRTILLEMPNQMWSEELLETVYAIAHLRKLRPVMAHIDRYPPSEVERLLCLGVAAQINAEAVCGLRTRRRCLEYVERGVVWALGSDIHGRSRAYSLFAKAQRHLGRAGSQVMERSAALLAECGGIE